ncbi:MAG: hypothetical protein PWR10_1103 [Halanaerobiales bacterium]|nr:hypothetical protein [Halanaerobiales bacterium]
MDYVFLQAVNRQAKKGIKLIKEINNLYEQDLNRAKEIISSSSIVDLVNAMYRYPIFTVNKMSEITGIPDSSCRRYLSKLVDENIIFSDGKARGRKYYYYNLLDLIR